MSSFTFFVFVWPVVGSLLFCAFGLFLARRDRVLYERTLAEAARRQVAGHPMTTAMTQAEPMKANA